MQISQPQAFQAGYKCVMCCGKLSIFTKVTNYVIILLLANTGNMARFRQLKLKLEAKLLLSVNETIKHVPKLQIRLLWFVAKMLVYHLSLFHQVGQDSHDGQSHEGPHCTT